MPLGLVARLVDRPLLREALAPLGAFALVALGGVAGYATLGDVGVVEATFWLVDPTSIEIHFREHAGPARATKAFAVVVTVGLVLAGVWAGETVLAAAFGGQIREELERVQHERAVDDATDHVLICGYGMFGATIASRLADADREAVAIEIDEERADAARRDGHAVLTGDARRESVLREAGIDRARTLVAAIDDSNANIQIAITASQLAPGTRIVVRVGDETYEDLARRAGADEVVIPEVVSGEKVASSV